VAPAPSPVQKTVNLAGIHEAPDEDIFAAVSVPAALFVSWVTGDAREIRPDVLRLANQLASFACVVKEWNSLEFDKLLMQFTTNRRRRQRKSVTKINSTREAVQTEQRQRIELREFLLEHAYSDASTPLPVEWGEKLQRVKKSRKAYETDSGGGLERWAT
jgi:hypothetical protein